MATTLTILINLLFIIVGAVFYYSNNKAIAENRRWPSDMHQDMKRVEFFITILLIIPLTGAIYMAIMEIPFKLQNDSFRAACLIDYNHNYRSVAACCAFLIGTCAYYALKCSMLIYHLKDEYEDYRVAFDSRIMATPNMQSFAEIRKNHIGAHKVLCVFGVIGGMIATTIMALAINEYAYFDEEAFHFRKMWGKQYSYSADEFEYIYWVDYLIAPNGNVREEDYFVFTFKDGNQIEFRLNAQLTPEQLKYAREFTGLPIIKVASLDDSPGTTEYFIKSTFGWE